MLSSSFYTNNRAQFIASFEPGVVAVLAGHTLMQRTADSAYPFRQDSNVLYLSGISVPDAQLVVDSKKTVLLLPLSNDMNALWNGESSDADLKKQSGVDEVIRGKEAAKWLKNAVEGARNIAYLPPTKNAHFKISSNPAREHLQRSLRRWNKLAVLVDARPALVGMRRIKQPPEIEAIRRAVKITGTAIDDAVYRMKNMTHEHEFEAAITQGIRKNGASGHAYTPIIASGLNAATIHYEANNAPLLQGTMLLIDVGAEVDGYAADISRTLPVGRITQRQKDIGLAVIDAQKSVLAKLGPGMMPKEFEAITEKYMKQALIDLNILTKETSSKVRKYYPHGVSHSLGLDVHDVNDYRIAYEENMVITVEPGLYIPEEGVGVRIEDDILITSKGIDNLSAGIKTNYF